MPSSAMAAVAVRRERKKSKPRTGGSHQGSITSLNRPGSFRGRTAPTGSIPSLGQAGGYRGRRLSDGSIAWGHGPPYFHAGIDVDDESTRRMRVLMYAGTVCLATGLITTFIGVGSDLTSTRNIGLAFIGIGGILCAAKVIIDEKDATKVPPTVSRRTAAYQHYYHSPTGVHHYGNYLSPPPTHQASHPNQLQKQPHHFRHQHTLNEQELAAKLAEANRQLREPSLTDSISLDALPVGTAPGLAGEMETPNSAPLTVRFHHSTVDSPRVRERHAMNTRSVTTTNRIDAETGNPITTIIQIDDMSVSVQQDETESVNPQPSADDQPEEGSKEQENG